MSDQVKRKCSLSPWQQLIEPTAKQYNSSAKLRRIVARKEIFLHQNDDHAGSDISGSVCQGNVGT